MPRATALEVPPLLSTTLVAMATARAGALEVTIGVISSTWGIVSRGPAVTDAVKDFVATGALDPYNVTIRSGLRICWGGGE